eukprot:m.525088 g.525088  ORF g.525088 m.525088 type:complete len:686 (-) comp22000_c0_seq1:399-2456(-)
MLFRREQRNMCSTNLSNKHGVVLSTKKGDIGCDFSSGMSDQSTTVDNHSSSEARQQHQCTKSTVISSGIPNLEPLRSEDMVLTLSHSIDVGSQIGRNSAKNSSLSSKQQEFRSSGIPAAINKECCVGDGDNKVSGKESPGKQTKMIPSQSHRTVAATDIEQKNNTVERHYFESRQVNEPTKVPCEVEKDVSATIEQQQPSEDCHTERSESTSLFVDVGSHHCSEKNRSMDTQLLECAKKEEVDHRETWCSSHPNSTLIKDSIAVSSTDGTGGVHKKARMTASGNNAMSEPASTYVPTAAAESDDALTPGSVSDDGSRGSSEIRRNNRNKDCTVRCIRCLDFFHEKGRSDKVREHTVGASCLKCDRCVEYWNSKICKGGSKRNRGSPCCNYKRGPQCVSKLCRVTFVAEKVHAVWYTWKGKHHICRLDQGGQVRYYWNPKVFDASNPVSNQQAEIEWSHINAHHESQSFQEYFKDVADIKLKEVLVHRGIEDSVKGKNLKCSGGLWERSDAVIPTTHTPATPAAMQHHLMPFSAHVSPSPYHHAGAMMYPHMVPHMMYAHPMPPPAASMHHAMVPYYGNPPMVPAYHPGDMRGHAPMPLVAHQPPAPVGTVYGGAGPMPPAGQPYPALHPVYGNSAWAPSGYQLPAAYGMPPGGQQYPAPAPNTPTEATGSSRKRAAETEHGAQTQ